MIHCKNCIHWIDESLEQIEADHGAHSHIFMGCRILGTIDKNHALAGCRFYVASENLFTICHSCKLTVPKVCVSLGECANCMDTDLFCVDFCLGDENRKYCTHFVRIHTEGVHLIENDQVFELFPAIGMPAPRKSPDFKADSVSADTSNAPKPLESQAESHHSKTRPKHASKALRSRNSHPVKTDN